MKVSNNNSICWKVRLYPTSLFMSKNVKVVARWLTHNKSQVHFPSGSMPTTTNIPQIKHQTQTIGENMIFRLRIHLLVTYGAFPVGSFVTNIV